MRKQLLQKLLQEFEYTIELAELKALSKISLERPLSDQEFKRMMELKNNIFL